MSMLCYQCGSQLGAGKFCLRCGADVQQYRKIVRLGGRYYNEGLSKAKVRDLSGERRSMRLPNGSSVPTTCPTTIRRSLMLRLCRKTAPSSIPQVRLSISSTWRSITRGPAIPTLP